MAEGPGNFGYAQTIFNMTVACPYNFGVVTEVLNEPEAPVLSTSAWRSVYSPMVRGAEEILVDELAARFGKDPVAFRRSVMKDDAQRAVLDAVAGRRQLGPGHARRATPRASASTRSTGQHDRLPRRDRRHRPEEPAGVPRR